LTLKTILDSVIKNNIFKYQIIFIDDCSKDKTYDKLLSIKQNNKNITIVKNSYNEGFGGSFLHGLNFAEMEYSMLLPGDNAHLENDISLMINNIKKNDFIITYYTNSKDRIYMRYLFTKIYTPFLNFIYGTDIPYFNGTNIYRTTILKDLNIKNTSFSFQIEIILNFLFLKKKYTIVPTLLNEDKKKQSISKAFSMKNIYLVSREITKLFIKFRLLKRL
jgi:glycosyltransferase involved in cell wall biosynthesis